MTSLSKVWKTMFHKTNVSKSGLPMRQNPIGIFQMRIWENPLIIGGVDMKLEYRLEKRNALAVRDEYLSHYRCCKGSRYRI